MKEQRRSSKLYSAAEVSDAKKKTPDRTAKQVKVLLSYLTAVWKHVGSHHDYKLKSAPIGRVIILLL